MRPFVSAVYRILARNDCPYPVEGSTITEDLEEYDSSSCNETKNCYDAGNGPVCSRSCTKKQECRTTEPLDRFNDAQ